MRKRKAKTGRKSCAQYPTSAIDEPLASPAEVSSPRIYTHSERASPPRRFLPKTLHSVPAASAFRDEEKMTREHRNFPHSDLLIRSPRRTDVCGPAEQLPPSFFSGPDIVFPAHVLPRVGDLLQPLCIAIPPRGRSIRRLLWTPTNFFN